MLSRDLAESLQSRGEMCGHDLIPDGLLEVPLPSYSPVISVNRQWEPILSLSKDLSASGEDPHAALFPHSFNDSGSSTP
jgi:hypothetical protein